METVRARRAERGLKLERQSRADDARRAVASLVASTVDVNPEPSDDASHYIQRASLQIANQSAEPVFNVRVIVAVSDPPVPIGPLAAPAPIPVLPAGHKRTWDITVGLLAHARLASTLGMHPTTELFFTDSQGERWHRAYDGKLSVASKSKRIEFRDISDGNEAQLGELDNHFNPLPIVLAFLDALTSKGKKPTVEDIAPLLSPTANGWEVLTDAAVAEMGEELSAYGLAAHIWYPAPFVAWARLIRDDDARVPVQTGEFRSVDAKILTLCFLPTIGWRVFGIGPTAPDWIAFPPGSLTDDPRGGL